MTPEQKRLLRDIIQRLGLDPQAEITPFVSEEDGSEYAVWKIRSAGGMYVLKKAKGNELAVFDAFFREGQAGAPRFFGQTTGQGESYFLMEYIEGTDLCRCDRDSLRAVLDALTALQDRYWENTEYREAGLCFADSLPGRRKRGEYLGDPVLERAYRMYLERYETVPRTLCHDDLLPFNVIVSPKRAVLIDWEHAGILPYLSSLARLIAHGDGKEDAFFHMTDADKAFAAEYYYENLVKHHGISREEYRRDLDLFLLYELCEWIMLGIRYGETDSDRYREYRDRAQAQLKKIF